MTKIFISYRRDDSAYATGVIRDQLVKRLPGCEVFLDVDSIPYGVDFRKHLEGSVAACDYLIAVIGKRWLTAADSQGRLRLNHPDDAVRVEVETALRRKIPLIPVFLDGMDVPAVDALPESLRELVSRNAIFVRPPPDFNHDVNKLVQSFKDWLEIQQSAVRPAATAPLPVTRPAMARRTWLAAALLLLAATAWGAWRWRATLDDLPDYELGENYLYEDSQSIAIPWSAHSRMLGGGFQMPLRYVHWVVHVKHARDVPPVKIPIECRMLDEQGEIVKLDGLQGELPNAEQPHASQSEWILTFGGREALWKPGTYTLQLDTPTQSKTISFQVFPE